MINKTIFLIALSELFRSKACFGHASPNRAAVPESALRLQAVKRACSGGSEPKHKARDLLSTLPKETIMTFEAAKKQLAALTPEGRIWTDGDGYLDLVLDQAGESLSLGLGVVGDDDSKEGFLLARVVLYADCFSDCEEVDEEMVIAAAAKALNLPEDMECQVGIEVYDGSTNEEGQMVPVEEEGEIEVDAFEVHFSPEQPVSSLDSELLRRLIADAPYILPTEE